MQNVLSFEDRVEAFMTASVSYFYGPTPYFFPLLEHPPALLLPEPDRSIDLPVAVGECC